MRGSFLKKCESCCRVDVLMSLKSACHFVVLLFCRFATKADTRIHPSLYAPTFLSPVSDFSANKELRI
jgi:hypothetical protein